MTTAETPDVLTPAFEFGAPNQSVLLAEDKVSIEVGGIAYAGRGEVRLDLLPRSQICFYTGFQELPSAVALPLAFRKKEITSFIFGEKKVDGFSLGIGGDTTKQEFSLRWCSQSEPITGGGDESTEIHRLVFHLFNFKDIHGTHFTLEVREKEPHRIQHLELVSDCWTVELRSLVETAENFKKLNAEGGYGLTHIGSLRRTDHHPFLGKEAEETLQALRFYFSFAKGIWCNPICAVGFDASNNRVWESWSSPKEAWHSPLSWFDPHHSAQLAMLFPGFMEMWNIEHWREAIQEVIYWYLNSNHSWRGIDAGIVLTQTAIERFSYEYAVKDRRLIEANGFKDLRASDKFRLLFSSLDIPIAIPDSLSEMTRLGKQFNWLDSPHALTEMRNSLIHPEHKRRGQYADAYFEAWNLGLWYLELALLRVCGYTGSYGNRLLSRWIGGVEDVPWKR